MVVVQAAAVLAAAVVDAVGARAPQNALARAYGLHGRAGHSQGAPLLRRFGSRTPGRCMDPRAIAAGISGPGRRAVPRACRSRLGTEPARAPAGPRQRSNAPGSRRFAAALPDRRGRRPSPTKPRAGRRAARAVMAARALRGRQPAVEDVPGGFVGRRRVRRVFRQLPARRLPGTNQPRPDRLPETLLAFGLPMASPVTGRPPG